MKILIAIPCMDQVPAVFAQSLATMRKVGDCVVAMQIGSLIYTSRNSLAQKAIMMEADYVLWLDSDMVFTPDLLERMLERLQKDKLDFLTGLYFRRVRPFSPVLFDRLEMVGNVCNWSEFKDIPDEPFEVGGCGFGCVLMDTAVFLDVHSRFGNMFAPIGNTGEDLAFCWRARECGYKIICDPAITCGHVSHIVINQEFYRGLKNVNA